MDDALPRPRASYNRTRDNFDEWLSGGDAAALLRPMREDALREWIVSPRVNRSGVGDDDSTMIEPVVMA